MSLIHGLHHVALRAGDFDRSVAFYTEVLGFATKIAWGEKPGRAVMLDAGDGNYVEVFERPGDPPATDDPPPVLLHFAIRTHDVDAATERAREAGCRITMEPKDVDIPTTVGPHPTPVRIAFFRGPDNEEIELFQNELT